MALALMVILTRKVDLVPLSIKDLQIFRFLKNGMVDGIKHNILVLIVVLILKSLSSLLKKRDKNGQVESTHIGPI